MQAYDHTAFRNTPIVSNKSRYKESMGACAYATSRREEGSMTSYTTPYYHDVSSATNNNNYPCKRNALFLITLLAELQKEDLFNERVLLFWVNSLPVPSCLLVSSLVELRDGTVLADMIRRLYRDEQPPPPPSSPQSLVQWVLEALQRRTDGLPSSLASSYAAMDICKGDKMSMLHLLAFFRFAFGEGADPRSDIDRNEPPAAVAGMEGSSSKFSASGGRHRSAASPMPSTALRKALTPRSASAKRSSSVTRRRPSPSISRHGYEVPLNDAPLLSSVHRRSLSESSRKSRAVPSERGIRAQQATTPTSVTRRPRVDASGMSTPRDQVIGSNVGASMRTPSPMPLARQIFTPVATPSLMAGPLPSVGGSSMHRASIPGPDSGTVSSGNVRMPTPTRPLKSLFFGVNSRRPGAAVSTSTVASPPRRLPSDRSGSHTVSRGGRSTQDVLNVANDNGAAVRNGMAARLLANTEDVVVSMTKEQEDIANWLLDVGVECFGKRSGARVTSQDVLAKSSAGLLLCELASLLLRQEVHGTDLKPKSRAAMVSNVNRALSLFRDVKSMNIRYLWSVEEIVDGEPDVIWGLLDDIRKVFDESKSWKSRTTSKNKQEQQHKHSGSVNGVLAHLEKLNQDAQSSVGRSAASHESFLPEQRQHMQVPQSTPLPPAMRRPSAPGLATGGAGGGVGESVNYSTLPRPSMTLQTETSDSDEQRLEKQNACKRFLMKLGLVSTDFEMFRLDAVSSDNPVHLSDRKLSATYVGRSSDPAENKLWNHPLRDPRRNGTLLCDLMATLEGVSFEGIIRHPKTVAAARDNIEKALSVLRQKRQIPTSLVWAGEEIVKGNDEILWDLVWHIMKAYPNAQALRTAHSRLKERGVADPRCTYDGEQLRRLEVATMLWLNSLGLFRYSPSPATTLDESLSELQNGVLFCDLTSLACGKKILGITRKPKVKGTAMANISKALELLRKRRDMCNRFLWCDMEIYSGNKVVILGLLEDIHRMYDGVPPRPTLPHSDRAESPYLGEFQAVVEQMDFSSLLDPKDEVGSILFGRRDSDNVRASTFEASLSHRPVTPPMLMKSSVPTPARLSGHDILSQPPGHPETFQGVGNSANVSFSSIPSPSSALNFSSLMSSQKRRPSQTSVAPPTLSAAERAVPESEGQTAPRRSSLIMPPQPSRLPVPAAGSGMRRSSTPKRVTLSTMPVVENGATQAYGMPSVADLSPSVGGGRTPTAEDAALMYEQQVAEVEPSRGYLICKWLESLGIALQSPFALDGSSAPEFSNGVLLCDIVEAVHTEQLRGVSRNPKSSASALHNIRKALEALRSRKNMPLDYLWSEADIARGNTQVLVNLLDQMRKAFGQKLSAVARKKETDFRVQRSIQDSIHQSQILVEEQLQRRSKN